MIRPESKAFTLERKIGYEYSEKTIKPRIGRPETKKVRGKRRDRYLLCWHGKGGEHRIWISAKTGEEVEQRSESVPVSVSALRNNRVLWAFSGRLYTTADEDDLTPDEVEALVREKENKRRIKIARAKAIAAMAESLDRRGKREPIPRELKVAVWQRDEGKCCQCGSNVDLEFDHIVPLALGGANTERNLQLLCARCNREKGASI